jgi:hypothetical protein
VRKIVCLLVLVSFIGLLCASCTENSMLNPSKKKGADEITAGEVHNRFVTEYMEQASGRGSLSRAQRVRAYVEAAQSVCKEENYEYRPTEESMLEFLAACEGWRTAGIWDIYNPTKISPLDALDRFVQAGVIPGQDAPYLRRLLEGLQLESAEPRGPSFCPAAPNAEMETARNFLLSSCELWYDRCGTIPIEFSDPELARKWWKSALKYLGVGACDGLAGWAAFYAFGGNPFAVGFFGGIASVAAYDAFDERGW